MRVRSGCRLVGTVCFSALMYAAPWGLLVSVKHWSCAQGKSAYPAVSTVRKELSTDKEPSGQYSSRLIHGEALKYLVQS